MKLSRKEYLKKYRESHKKESVISYNENHLPETKIYKVQEPNIM